MVRLYDAVNAIPRESLGRDAKKALPSAVARLEDDLLDRLAAVAEGRMSKRSSGESRELANVADAKMWLEANAHRPIRLSDVSAHLGIPARAVERAFVRTGCTAQMFLRSVRLERAHDLLARGGETNVVAAAHAAGFSHVGRFASDFNQRYGVLPSAVLRGRAGV
jgi:AraC-like DNA-binding protein